MADCVDDCPDDPDKVAPGICGCGIPEDSCPPPTIAQWRSGRSHGDAGELDIVLNASASEDGNSGPTVETRNGGIKKIEVDFDGPLTLVNPAGIGVFGQTTVAGVLQGVVDYSGAAAVSLLDSDTLQLVFAAGALPDETCYTIVVSPTAIAESLSGDTDCLIRSLIGDTNSSGTNTITDMAQVKSKLNAPVQDWPRFDLNANGAITTSDQLLAKSRNTSPTKTALCP